MIIIHIRRSRRRKGRERGRVVAMSTLRDSSVEQFLSIVSRRCYGKERMRLGWCERKCFEIDGATNNSLDWRRIMEKMDDAFHIAKADNNNQRITWEVWVRDV
jgi:hypothetical protein